MPKNQPNTLVELNLINVILGAAIEAQIELEKTSEPVAFFFLIIQLKQSLAALCQ